MQPQSTFKDLRQRLLEVLINVNKANEQIEINIIFKKEMPMKQIRPIHNDDVFVKYRKTNDEIYIYVCRQTVFVKNFKIK